jgi:acyl carrier protein
MSTHDDQLEWDEFAARVAEATGVDAARVRPETRLVEDLELDSLAITEVVVVLLVDFQLDGLSERLQRSGWQDITAGDVYEELRNGKRGGWDLRVE